MSPYRCSERKTASAVTDQARMKTDIIRMMTADSMALAKVCFSMHSQQMHVLSDNGTVPCVPRPSVVYIWCQDTETLDQVAVKNAEARLSNEERARGNRFRLPRDRRDYIVAHDLLRRSLEGLERSATPPSFSLSHARGVVACAIATGMPVGVDVERIDPALDIDELLDRHLTPVEMSALRRCSDQTRSARFVELWTLKEAFVKAIGRGMAMDLKMVSFELDGRDRIRFTAPPGVDGRTWHFGLFAPSDSTRLSVAVCSEYDAPALIARHRVAGESAICRIA